MMRNFLKKTSSFLFLFCFFYSFAIGANIKTEKLLFDVKYLWFVPIGHLVITAEPYLLNKKDIYQISTTYESPRWISLFFNFKGKANSYVDSKKLLPLRYEEFYSYTLHDDVNTVLIYDQDRKQVYIDRNGEKETKKIYKDTLDPLSALFFFRNQDWQINDELKLNLNNHQNNYQLVVRHDRKEYLNEKYTKHLVGHIRKPSDQDDMVSLEFEAWILDEDSRLPIKLTVHTKMGPLTLNLKHE